MSYCKTCTLITITTHLYIHMYIYQPIIVHPELAFENKMQKPFDLLEYCFLSFFFVLIPIYI